jgi:hypothetical protein
MKRLAALTFSVAVAATSAIAWAATASVSVTPSNISFKDALAACPGALGGISFTLGHVRVSEAAGVETDIDDAGGGVQNITLTNVATGKSAAIVANGKTNTVAAAHATLASRSRVACIAAD